MRFKSGHATDVTVSSNIARRIGFPAAIADPDVREQRAEIGVLEVLFLRRGFGSGGGTHTGKASGSGEKGGDASGIGGLHLLGDFGRALDFYRDLEGRFKNSPLAREAGRRASEIERDRPELARLNERLKDK